MDKKLSKKGLKIVAPEVQGSTVEAINSVIEDGKIEYTVTKGISGPRLGNSIPRTAVFDVNGKLIHVGHPMADDTEKAIKTALKDVEESETSSSSLPERRQELVALRAWTNTDGNSLQASLVSLSGNTGTFRKSNGQTFEYDISKLSAEDQELIKKAAEPEADE